MEKFRQWLQNLMRDRYGTDDLNFFLLIVGIIIMIFGSVLANQAAIFACTLIAVVLYALVLSRTFSKDRSKREMENYKFKHLFNKKSDSIKQAEKEKKRLIKEKRKTHILFYCPECKQSCWVPKGKGKVRVTCPKCGNKFIGKT